MAAHQLSKCHRREHIHLGAVFLDERSGHPRSCSMKEMTHDPLDEGPALQHGRSTGASGFLLVPRCLCVAKRVPQPTDADEERALDRGD